MTLRVLFFSTLRQETGQESMNVDHPGESWTIAGLLESLYHQFPTLQAWDQQILVAVDHDYADRSTLLRDGQEIAIMPPVQGG